ncbi:MAG: ABC transporter ATP-binding protein [Microbacterium sp.]
MRGIPEPYVAPAPGLSAPGFLVWICRRQWRSILTGSFYDVVWLLGLALTPWATGHVIDDGIVAEDAAAFALWISVVVWLQLQHSLIQGLRDRAGILNWRRAFGRTYQVVSRTAARNATAAERRLSPGAAATMATNDAFSIGFLPIMIGSLAASVVSYVVVGVLLLRDSPLLGALVLVGVPVFSGVLFVLVKPLRERQSAARAAAERMNEVAGDTIRGLRVLRGIGGERAFLARYRERSAAARDAGIHVAWPVAGVEAIKLAVSGVLLVGLTWIGAALVVAGRLTVGELVAFYGYAGFMVLPVTLVAQAVTTGVQAQVGARKIVGLLGARPLVEDVPGAVPLQPSATARSLRDDLSRVDVGAGETVGVVPESAADAVTLADRFARLTPPEAAEADARVELGERDAETLRLADLRREVVVSDAVPFLFSGPLRTLLDPDDEHSDDEVRAALAAAAATDILDSARDGLATDVGERAREFSGGQRQRLGVARAMLRARGALVLLDPTSSVDAVTEGRMAAGIREHRADRTTLIATTSPLVLAETDRVQVLVDGAVVTAGAHTALLGDPGYRSRVLREEGSG